jgi:hypothetical protein
VYDAKYKVSRQGAQRMAAQVIDIGAGCTVNRHAGGKEVADTWSMLSRLKLLFHWVKYSNGPAA